MSLSRSKFTGYIRDNIPEAYGHRDKYMDMDDVATRFYWLGKLLGFFASLGDKAIPRTWESLENNRI